MIEGRCYLVDGFGEAFGFAEGSGVGALDGENVGAWYRKMS